MPFDLKILCVALGVGVSVRGRPFSRRPRDGLSAHERGHPLEIIWAASAEKPERGLSSGINLHHVAVNNIDEVK